MKITADTNFFVSATQWNYSVAHKFLKILIEKNHEIFTANELISEFAEILERDFRYTKEEIKKKTEELIKFVKVVQVKNKINFVKRDPDDNIVLECAKISLFDYIVTYDKDLLDIREYERIKIVKPEELIGTIKNE